MATIYFFLVQDDVPFSEDEFRRRRAHPNFKEHYHAEKLITKLGLTVKIDSERQESRLFLNFLGQKKIVDVRCGDRFDLRHG